MSPDVEKILAMGRAALTPEQEEEYASSLMLYGRAVLRVTGSTERIMSAEVISPLGIYERGGAG